MTNINHEGFAVLCHQIRAKARTDDEDALLRELLVPLRLELGFDDPREGVLPAGYTTREDLWNNVRYLFDHSFRKLPYFDLNQTIKKELLSKPESD